MSLRLLVLVVLALAATALPVLAQSPRLELSASYSRLPADGDDFPRPDSNGAIIDLAGNLTGWFGVFGELAWYRGTTSDLGLNFPGRTATTSVRQYLVGPRFTMRGAGADVFVHGLFGSSTGDAGPTFEGFSDSGITFGGGGGVDLHLTRRFGVRAQIDWIGSFADIIEDNTRIALGGVARF
jgi:hypothetical protein